MSKSAEVVQKPRRLGRGLSSLIGGPVIVTPAPAAESQVDANKTRSNDTKSAAPLTVAEGPAASSGLVLLPIAELVPNRFQPRTAMEPAGGANMK